MVVADARPDGEGRATLRALLRAGIACTYVLLNAVPLVLQARVPDHTADMRGARLPKQAAMLLCMRH